MVGGGSIINEGSLSSLLDITTVSKTLHYCREAILFKAAQIWAWTKKAWTQIYQLKKNEG